MADLQAHLETLENHPDQWDKLEPVVAELAAGKRWEELVRVYEGLTRRWSADNSASLMVRAAVLCQQEIGSASRAESYFHRACEFQADFPEALQGLRNIYLEREDYESAVEVWEKELARVEDPTAKGAGLVEVARILVERLARPERAVTLLRMAQRAAPSLGRVYEGLARIYLSQERLDQAHQALMKELECEDAGTDILERLAQLSAQLLNHPKLHEQCSAAVEAVLSKQPDDETARHVKNELDEFRNTWPQRVAAAQQQADGLMQNSPPEAAALWVTIAEVQLVYGEQPDEALRSLDKALAAQPGHDNALRILEQVYASQDRFDELALKLEMMASYTREPSAAVELYLKAAMHNAVRLDNPEAAGRIYQRVLELDPGNKVASNALAEHYRETKEWDQALQVLADWAGRATQAEDKVAAYYACARILEEELARPDDAREHYELILSLDPKNQAAARALESAYRQAGDHAALVKTLQAKLSGLAERERLDVLEELSDLLAGPLSDAEGALRTLGDAFRIEPTADRCEKLEELGARSGDFAQLVTILQDGLERIDDQDDQVRVMASLAALYEGAREDPLEALRVHRRILSLRPEDERAKESVERLLESASGTGDKIKFFEEQAEAASSDEERISLLFKLANELVENAKDYIRAADVYQRIIALDGSSVEAVDGLLVLYRRDNRWAEVADTLVRKLELVEAADARAAIGLEVGEILEQRLDQVDRAVEWYSEVLALDAHNEGAILGLERLLNRSRRVNQIAELLQPRYAAQQSWDKVCAMIEIRLGELSEPAERAPLLIQLSEIYEKQLGQQELALSAVLRALQADPTDTQLQSTAERLAQASGNYQGVVRAYRGAGASLEGAERLQMLQRAAMLAEQTGDTSGAISDHMNLMILDPQADGRDALMRLSQQGLNASEFLHLAQQAAGAFEPMATLRFWSLLARFFVEQLQQPRLAINVWRLVLDIDANNQEAAEQLDQLYRTSADPQELVEHLRTRYRQTSDDSEKAALGVQIASVLAEGMSDLDRGIDELVEVAKDAPGRREVWQKLAEFYIRAERIHEASDAYQRELGLLSEGPERFERLVAYAQFLADRHGDVPAALKALQGVTMREPKHPGALALLEQWSQLTLDPPVMRQVNDHYIEALTGAEKWQDAVRLHRQQLTHLEDVSERARYLVRCAEILADKLEDFGSAYQELEKAFREQPADPALREQIETMASRAGAWEPLAHAYQAAIDAGQDEDVVTQLRRKLAEILDTRLGRSADAIEQYQAAHASGLPEDLPSLEALERLMRAENRDAELAEVLTAMASRVPLEDGDRRSRYLAEIAQLAETALQDKGRAVDTYKALVQIKPGQEALHHLDRLLAELGRPDERVEVLEKLVDFGSANTQLVDDLVQSGQVFNQLGRVEEAIDRFKSVLLKKREHAEALAGLESLMDRAEDKLDLAQTLEPIYTAKQDHDRLADVLLLKLDATEELTQRKGLLRRIGDIYENRLQQKDRAFAMARRSLGEDPGDMGVRMWIEKLASETGALKELSDAYIEEAERAEDQLRLQFHRRAAALLHEKLQDYPGAVSQYQAILAVEERDEKALNGLESIYRATENYEELVGLLSARLALTAGLERRREYLGEIATLQFDQLGRLEDSVATLKEILAIAPDDVEAFEKVETLYTESLQWEPLIAFYQAESDRLKDRRGRDAVGRRLGLLYKMARAVEEQLSDRERAATIFREVLEEDDQHSETISFLQQRALDGSMEAMDLLGEVYVRREEWQNVVNLSENRLKFTAETDARRDILVRIAELYDEKLDASDLAFQSFTRAYQENRADLELVDFMERVAEKTGTWSEMVGVLAVDLDAMDNEVRQSLLRRIGRLSGEKVGNVQQAIQFYQSALQYDPSDSLALEALDDLLEANQLWAALADLLERRIELALEPSAKSKLLERLASVWGDRLSDAEAALRCHQQILEIDPDHPISLKSSQKLYAEVQDWDALARNLARQAEVLTEPDEQVRIHSAAGSLYAEELNDFPQAITHWLEVVKHAPSHDVGNAALEALLTAEDRWEDLADLYQNQLAHTQDAEAKSEINARLGVILGEKLGRTEDALGSWLEVLREDPKNLDALRALIGLYQERAMWSELAENARRLVPLTDPTEAKEVRFTLARALGENLGEREEAIRLAREVRAQEPHTPDEMRRLADLLTNIEAYAEAVLALEKLGSIEEEDEAKVRAYYEATELYRTQIGNPVQARSALEALREVKPDDGLAYEYLSDLYREIEDWRSLVALNDEFLPFAPESERIRILTEIRDVHDQQLGERELAFIAACRVYKENPADVDAAEVLERIALESDAAEEAVAVLEDDIDAIADSEIRISMFRRISRLYAEHVGDTTAAEEALERILRLEPADLEAIQALAHLGEREERYDKQIAALERKFEQLDEDGPKKSALFDVARIWEDQIGENDEAIEALNRVLEIDASDRKALEELARLQTSEANWTDLAHTLTRTVELAEDAQEGIALRTRIAALCEKELDDPEAAIQWYRGVLEFEQGHWNTLVALERLYTTLERWSELIQVFELQIASTSDSEQQIQILAKMAQIYEGEFESSKDAANCYERVLALDNTHLVSVRNLQRLLRSLGEWHRLIEVLQHHITLLKDANEITDLYLEVGEIYYRELSRVDKAEEVYTAARDFNPNSEAAIAALGTLYERSGNWFQSLEMLQREVDTIGAEERALPILVRVGRINEEMLLDMPAAQAAYQRALDIDPTFGPALQALKEIAKQNEDWDAYSEHLITEAESCDDPEERTDLYCEAARFYLDIREDEPTAVRFFQRALELTPGHLESNRLLAEITFRNEEWVQAKALYESVLEQIDVATDPKDFCQKNYRLGYISEKLGDRDASLGYYRAATEADASYLPALEGLAQALLVNEEWEEAQRSLQTVLIHHRESLTESEIVDIQWQLGDICLKQTQPERAYKQFEKALEIDPDHTESLRSLASLDVDQSNWTSAFARLSRLAEGIAGADRGVVLIQAADIARDHLEDSARSVTVLEKARRLPDASSDVLERLANEYLSLNQSQKAAEALEEAVTAAEDGARKSELCFRLANVYETQVMNAPLAVQFYNESLEASATNFQAFEAIERILGERQEWGLLEENYRAMIARARAEKLSPKVRGVLWKNLGELYRQVLRQNDHATAAYEVLSKLDNSDVGNRLVLAELYSENPARHQDAIQLYHQLLGELDNPVEPIRRLRRLYHAQQQFDPVYVLCSALVFLKEADEEEQKVFQYLQRGIPPRGNSELPNEDWSLLLDPAVGNPVGALAAALYRGAPDFVTLAPKEFGLKSKDLINVQSSDLYFANMMRYVIKLLNVHAVELYRKTGSMDGLQFLHSQPPSLAAGESSDVFRDTAQRVVMYQIGRNVTYARPELFLGKVMPGEQLREALLGLCGVFVGPGIQHQSDPRNVNAWAQRFAGIPKQTLQRLQNFTQAAYPALTSGNAVAEYQAAVERTAARAGLVAAGDLGAAVRGVTESGDVVTSVPTKQRVKELVLFSVSPAFFEIRRKVGAALPDQVAQSKQAG